MNMNIDDLHTMITPDIYLSDFGFLRVSGIRPSNIASFEELSRDLAAFLFAMWSAGFEVEGIALKDTNGEES